MTVKRCYHCLMSLRFILLIGLLVFPAAVVAQETTSNATSAEQISSDTASQILAVGHKVAWLTSDGVLHIQGAQGSQSVTLPCTVFGGQPSSCGATSLSLGLDRSGADVASVIIEGGLERYLLNVPLDGSSAYRPAGGSLPPGTFFAGQWASRILLGVLGSRDEHDVYRKPGVFIRSRGRWARLRYANPRSLAVRGRWGVYDAYNSADYTRQLRLIDFAHPARRRVLAYNYDVQQACHYSVYCSGSAYEASQLTQRYVYVEEFATSYTQALSQEVTYLCRFNLRDSDDVSRWQAPRPLGPFSVVDGMVYAAPRADTGNRAPGIFRYTPQWSPATTATSLEGGNPCRTSP